MNQTSQQVQVTTTKNASPLLIHNVSVLLRSPRYILFVVITFAVVLRVGSALFQGNVVQSLPGVYDQISYDLLARRLIAGYGFSFAEVHWPITGAGEPTAHWSYLYTLYLSAVYALTGSQPLVARLFQAGIAGILHCWLAWRIGRHVGGALVGIISAAVSAVYIYFFYYAGALMTETFYIIAILWTLDCAIRLVICHRQEEESCDFVKHQWRFWSELGLAVGVTVLFRQVFLLFLPFLYLWLWWALLRKPLPARGANPSTEKLSILSGTVLTSTIVVLLIVPWTLRNYWAFDTFVPLNTNSGFAYFWGNHPIYGTQFVGILPADGPSYQELIPSELRHLNEAELDRALLKEGIKFVQEDPVRYLLLSFSRTREYFKFWPSPDSSRISNLSRVFSFGLLLPFILYGLWIGAKRIRYPVTLDQRASIVLLLLFALFYTSIHLLTWALIRYRLPVDAVLVLFAALGIESLVNRFHPPSMADSVSV